jgi:hypothetical protein
MLNKFSIYDLKPEYLRAIVHHYLKLPLEEQAQVLAEYEIEELLRGEKSLEALVRKQEAKDKKDRLRLQRESKKLAASNKPGKYWSVSR